MGARPSGRFSGNEPMRLEFSESCGRSDSEAASTPHSDTDNLWMVRQEKLSRIEGESPSRLNMHDNTKT